MPEKVKIEFVKYEKGDWKPLNESDYFMPYEARVSYPDFALAHDKGTYPGVIAVSGFDDEVGTGMVYGLKSMDDYRALLVELESKGILPKPRQILLDEAQEIIKQPGRTDWM